MCAVLWVALNSDDHIPLYPTELSHYIALFQQINYWDMISMVPYCRDVIPYGRDLISRVTYGRELAQGPELMSLLMSESGQNVLSAFN